MKKLTMLLTIFLSVFIAAPSAVIAYDGYVLSISDSADTIENNQASFTVTVAPAIQDGDTVTVDYTTGGGTATGGDDYPVHTSTPLTITGNGTTEAYATVDVSNDSFVEDTENFNVTIDNPINSGGTVSITTSTASCNIIDTDQYTLSVANSVDVTEGGQASFRVSITPAIHNGHTVTVDYQATAGTATSGSDYTVTNDTLTFNTNGQTFQDVTVDTTDDAVVESTETFSLAITNPNSSVGLATAPFGSSQGWCNILDNDIAILTINDQTVNEAAGTMTLTVSLDNPVDIAVDVDVTYGDVTASGGGIDYDSAADQVTFAAGNTADKTVTVAITNDNLVEATETFTASLGTATALGTRSTDFSDTGTGTITDDDSATVSIAATDANAAEPGDDGEFTVSISNQSGTATVISYTVTGDATEGSDYTALSGSVTIPSNTSSTTIAVSVIDDGLVEDDETVTVTLTAITGGNPQITIGATNNDTVTITDDDSAIVSIAATDAAAAEPGDDGEFTVSISNQSDTATVISYTVAGDATAGSDYTTLTGSVTILANSTTGTIEVEVSDDNLAEDNETVTVTLTGITSGDAEISIDGANNEDTVTIADDDTATFTINDQTVNEAGGTMTLTVSLDNPLDIAVDVDVTYGDVTATGGGTDYDSATDQVTFGAGDAADKTVTVAITNDNLLEATETFTASLGTATALGTRSTDFSDTGTGTITDNDTAFVSIVANDAAAAEPADDGQFTVTMTNQSDTDTVISYNVTYNPTGNATSGADYVALSGSVTISASATTATIDVDVIDDNLVEDNETVNVNLTSITSGDADITIGAPNSDTVTIADDGDTYNVSITNVAPNPVPEGDTTVTITVELSNVDINGVVGTVNVSYATSDSGANPATAGSDYTSTSGTLAFTSATGHTLPVDVPIINDDLLESDETFDFTLSGFSGGGSIAGINPETVTINDDTDKCGFSIDGPYTVTEGSSIAFNVSINQVVPAAQTVTVQYETVDDTAVAEGDYGSISLSTLTFIAGEGPGDVQQIIVNTNDDSLYEIQEHFTVDLSNPSPNAAIITGQGDGYIEDDGDQYDVSIELAETVIEGTDATVTFTVTLDQEVPGGTSVSFTLDDVTALLGSDYSVNTPLPTLSFAADETTKDVVVNIINDDLYEDPETFEINITCADPNSTILPPNGTGTCTINDDGIDTYNVSITAVPVPDPVLEADTTVIFTVTLDQEVPGGASVDFSLNDVTAALGSDYSQNTANPLNFGAGETTKDIIVNILNDQVDEDSESFEVIITSADSNAILVNDTGACTITDNDYTVTFNIATVGPGPDGGTVNGVLSLDQVVDHGTDCAPVTATAAPITEYRFVEWTGDYNGTVNPLTITNVTSDMTITANFIAFYTITANVTVGNGTISPSGAVIVDYGTDQTFIFDPDTCYEVDDVLVDGISEGGEIREYTFTNVTADHTIDVQFYHYDCTITATAEHGGTITPSGALTVPCGSAQSFTISAGMGNEIAEVLVDGVDLGLGTGITSYNHNWTNVKKDDEDTSPCVHYIVAKFTRPALSCMDISDVPLNAMSRSAPANIMFVLDDSGSMDWEFITDESDGLFSGEYYVFNNPGDNLYSDWQILSGTDRLRWESQWSGYNRMYYDRNVDYNHWPTLSNADPNSPRSHPMHAGNTLNLSGIYESVVSGVSTINITNAHYYVWSASNKPYLVIIDGGISYYEVNDSLADGGNGDNIVDYSELSMTASPPADVVTGRSYADERQNFANWYSFYRKRELTATAAIANVINSMQGVQIGLRGINGYDSDIIQPVHKIKVGGVDETSTLLNKLYNFDNQAWGTPLRRGLEAVGRYFHQYDGQDGGIGTSPYANVADGGECQQAFAIVMTDGYWNGGAPLTGAIANNDGDDSSAYDGAAPHGDEPYGDTYFDTLADVAMYYYENDLSTTLGPEVPQNPWDDNQQQHMVTYGVSFGVTGTLDPSAYDFISTFPIWPSPTAGNKQKIDDLWHASVNGRGFFLSASNPNELVNSLLEIMQNIEEREGSASSVSVNGDELYTKLSGGGDILMFQSSYDTENWTGDVKAYQVCTSLTGNCAGKNIGDIIKSTYVWSANEKLGGLNWDTGRKIVTYNGTDAGIPFRWTAGGLTNDQKTALNNDSTLLDYLRGDASNEVANLGSFRDRFAKLGDMVHSSPTFENGVLYAGGNNGMLHAFAAADDEPYAGAVGGQELFAYVPNLVFDNLSQLADPNYTHKYFVDLTPTVKAGVDISGVSTTMLVGGLGKGGRGYYALDVTDPTSWTSEGAIDDTVMWEYPKAGVTDDDMGYSFSKPAIIESNDDDVNGGSGWIVIFGNGYNSQNGHAVLYILNPETGVIIRKIDTGVDGCNGLSTAVPIDVDYDNKVDYVYAGDLRGNVWKFDLTDSDYTNWEVAFYDGEEKPLFQAQGPGGTTQPITAKPDIMYHPTEHGYMVLFGTGQYLGESDISDTTAQSFYGIWDYGDDEDDSEYLGYFRRGFGQELSNQPNTVSLLAQQVIPSEESDPNFWTVTINAGQPDEYNLLLRLTTDHDIVWETVSDGNNTPATDPLDDLSDSVDNHAGWYFDLPLSGERGTVDMMIRGGVLIAISFIPEDSPCGYGGSSVIHEINATSGARLTRPQFDINGDGVIDDDDMINIGTALNPIWVVPSGMKKSGQLQPPAILIDPEGDVEIKYFSSSSGTIEMVYEKPPLLGISHWREFE